MGLVEKWNKLARKNIYINGTFDIPVGRLIYMIGLNFFIMVGMALSGGTAASIMWLWADMLGSFNRKKKEIVGD